MVEVYCKWKLKKSPVSLNDWAFLYIMCYIGLGVLLTILVNCSEHNVRRGKREIQQDKSRPAHSHFQNESNNLQHEVILVFYISGWHNWSIFIWNKCGSISFCLRMPNLDTIIRLSIVFSPTISSKKRSEKHKTYGEVANNSKNSFLNF